MHCLQKLYKIVARHSCRAAFSIQGGNMEALFEEKEVEMEVDLNKRFHFPSELVVKRYEDSNIIIYTEGVLWLV